MGRIFGTDGVRGVANEKLDVELTLAISRAAGMVIKAEGKARPQILVGRDTRLSGTMLEAAACAGLTSVGCDVIRLGVVPTPAVAYLVPKLGTDGGMMITASHNPFAYNGIKYFGSTGFKLTDEQEDRIERIVLDNAEPTVLASAEEIGRISDEPEAVNVYAAHIASAVGDLSGLRIAVDCANGASSAVARKIFAKANADAVYYNDVPDGVNVNKECGSLFIENLGKTVRENGFDLGVAFDGDADRCLAVDENGCEVDGDRIMAICATYLTAQGRLPGEGFVATVMSNLGLHRFAEEKHLHLLCAPVGDRNVLELMQKEHMALGGEQSGHIIFLEHTTTGDGQLTALQFLSIVLASGKKVSELAAMVRSYPQILVNVPGPHDNTAKKALIETKSLQTLIRKIEQELAGEGRILVRPSGTEALIRVMAEASTEANAKKAAMAVAEAVENLQK